MNIFSMLFRLQSTLDRTDLVERMLLIPAAVRSPQPKALSEAVLMVAYSGSASSQAALDLTLWMAHQTRLATGQPVTVQVVYVADAPTASVQSTQKSTRLTAASRGSRSAVALTESAAQAVQTISSQFEQADRILWQARCLAEEWRGSLKTHLRFGTLSEELATVVEVEKADVLILGCQNANHPLVRRLGRGLPCPVIGIPPSDS